MSSFDCDSEARAPDQDMIMERELKKAQVRLGSHIKLEYYRTLSCPVVLNIFEL